MDAGVVSGLNASATFSYGTDTLRSVEMIRGTNLHDVYDATGFSASERQRGQPGHLQRVRRWRRQRPGHRQRQHPHQLRKRGRGRDRQSADRHGHRRRVGRQRHDRRGRQPGPRQQLRRHHHRHGRCRHPRRSRQHRHAQRRCRQRSSSWGRRKRHHRWRRQFRRRGVLRPSRRIHRDARSQPGPVDGHRQRRRSRRRRRPHQCGDDRVLQRLSDEPAQPRYQPPHEPGAGTADLRNGPEQRGNRRQC